MTSRLPFPIRDLLIDLDDTLFDFKETEAHAIAKTFTDLGLEPSMDLIELYSTINLSQWEAFERGEIQREEIFPRRFSLLFSRLGLDIAPMKAERIYRRYLGIGHYFVDGAPELLEHLSGRYRLYLASNGVAETQYTRLESSGIVPYFEEIFISENTGSHKPEKAYFDYCFARIPGFDPERTMIIGDSLSSDILGGMRAGIRTCWLNRKGKPLPDGICPDLTVSSLQELALIL